MEFTSYSSSNPTNLLTLKDDPLNGNFPRIGVGTTNPQATMHLIGIQDASRLYLENTRVFPPNNNTITFRDINGLKYLDVMAGTSGYFDFKTGNNTDLRISGNGNVGIGTTNPADKLTVNGSISNNSENSGTTLRFKSIGNDNWGIEHTDNPLGSSSESGLYGLGIRISEGNGYGFYIRDKITNAVRFAIANGGKVGIGTTNLNTTTYLLSVNGSIRAKEIKVETGWSDFVFGKEYKLMRLEELDKYIKENKHLPEIPSEKEVSENGVELGKMVSKLTQKIEELTLYMIELKKENNELKEKLETIINKK